MFSSLAYAAGPSTASGGGADMFVQFIPLILMFVVFYFLLIRPQQKKAKAHKAMLAALKKGDYVLTSAGLLGRILEIEGDVVSLDLGKTEVKVVRGYIGTVVDPKVFTGEVAAPSQQQ